MGSTREQKSDESCKKIACDFQACLRNNFFDPKRRCAEVMKALQLCCKKNNYESTHCDSLHELQKMSSNRFTKS